MVFRKMMARVSGQYRSAAGTGSLTLSGRPTKLEDFAKEFGVAYSK